MDRDARKMQPLVFALVLLFIYLAFRSRSAMPGPLLVVAGGAGGAMGIMAWLGIPYYAITTAPAGGARGGVRGRFDPYSDGVLSAPRLAPRRRRRWDLVVEAMVDMWRPITLTTVTTIAGFVGISVMSIMPPIIMFGWIAALGVALAWAVSLFALPNVIVLIDPEPSPASLLGAPEGQPPGRALAHIGSSSAA